jgi:hypothetical protein
VSPSAYGHPARSPVFNADAVGIAGDRCAGGIDERQAADRQHAGSGGDRYDRRETQEYRSLRCGFLIIRIFGLTAGLADLFVGACHSDTKPIDDLNITEAGRQSKPTACC